MTWARPSAVAVESHNPVDDELADFWYWLNQRQRLALCILSGLRVVASADRKWNELSTEERMALIRGMTELGALALDGAAALAKAREELIKHAGGL